MLILSTPVKQMMSPAYADAASIRSRPLWVYRLAPDLLGAIAVDYDNLLIARHLSTGDTPNANHTFMVK